MAIKWWTDDVEFADGSKFTPYFNTSANPTTLWNGTKVSNVAEYSGAAYNSYFSLNYLMINKGENVVNQTYLHTFKGQNNIGVKNIPHEYDAGARTSSEFGINTVQTTSYDFGYYISKRTEHIIGFIVDDVNNIAMMVKYQLAWSGSNKIISIETFGDSYRSAALYNALVGAIPTPQPHKGIFIGVNSTAKKVKKIYCGVNNKAKKVKKIFVGVNGQAKLVFSSGESPLIRYATSGDQNITVYYWLPEGTFDSRVLVYKTGSAPASPSDGSTKNIGASGTGESSTQVTGLDAGKTYYFRIFDTDSDGNIEESNAVSCETNPPHDFEFAYTGGIQTFTARQSGTYQLEVWGAQGGDVYTDWEMATKTCSGGRGTYSVGEVELTAGDTLYVCVGGKGESGVVRYGTPGHDTITRQGGYNGGGHGYDDYEAYAAGGGCTHIATASGQLYELANNKSSVLIVSAGGGGGITGRGATATSHDGFDGGGYRGDTNDTNSHYEAIQTQTDEQGGVHAFGIGSRNFPPDAPTNKYYYGGSSGGWYGGLSYAGNSRSLAGSGSSYIGNSRLTNKCMYTRLANGSNRYSSSAVDTKTVQALGYNANPVSQYMKEGNGYAKIHYLG